MIAGKKKQITGSKKVNYAEMIVVKLRDDIVSGRRRPNEHLAESEIAGQMKISRTPVREAFQLLEAQGYLSRLPNGRLIVTDHSPSQIRNLYEIREALEAMALKLACQRATDDEIAQAEDLHQQMTAAVQRKDTNAFTELNSAFHSKLFMACDNEPLWSLLRTYRDQYYDRRLVHVFSAADWRSMTKQHEMLLDAVRRRDPRLAEKAVHKHITTALRIAIERL